MLRIVPPSDEKGKKHQKLSTVGSSFDLNVSSQGVKQQYEYQPFSLAEIELNRKNLIITTNWLVNVDKRLTLDQAIPSIIFLQDKKRNAKMHRNDNAGNYYTCHDIAINNLGFLDFTNVYYHQENITEYVSKQNIKSYNTLTFTPNEVIYKNERIDFTELKRLKDSDDKLFLMFDKSLIG